MKTNRLFLAFCLGMVVGLAGETLLFIQGQCSSIEKTLKKDFKILLFVQPDFDEAKQKLIEEKLWALPDVENVRFVSKQSALAILRQGDPELVDSITFLSDNPLSHAFEVRLNADGLGRAADLIDRVQSLNEWTDVRYKPGQVGAVLQARFYGHLIRLSLSAIACLMVLMALAVFRRAVRSGKNWVKYLGAGAAAGAAGAAGAVLGEAFIALMVLPLRWAAPWWAWPPLAGQLAIILGASAAGWVLCRRQE